MGNLSLINYVLIKDMEKFVKYLLLLILVSEVTSLSLQEIETEWLTFKVKFNRTYDTRNNELYRYAVFTENLKSIHLHNMAADRGRYTYWLGVNKFADLTSKEFNEIYANLKVNASVTKRRTYAKHGLKHSNSQASLPSEIDWRARNCVTHVKDQGDCGSCYAFAATGALECQKYRKHGQLVSLSEQNIIDCTNNQIYRNDGCIKGMPDNAFRYVMENGIDTEDSYPYRGAIGRCNKSRGTVAVRALAYYDDIWPHGNVTGLQAAVAGIGPISVCIDTKGEGNKFQFYKHGVYDNRECNFRPANLNHAVLVVGYGNTTEGQGYWLIKNSYGTCWGMEGYMKMVRRTGENTCGIATRASYPVVQSNSA